VRDQLTTTTSDEHEQRILLYLGRISRRGTRHATCYLNGICKTTAGRGSIITSVSTCWRIVCFGIDLMVGPSHRRNIAFARGNRGVASQDSYGLCSAVGEALWQRLNHPEGSGSLILNKKSRTRLHPVLAAVYLQILTSLRAPTPTRRLSAYSIYPSRDQTTLPSTDMRVARPLLRAIISGPATTP
jgi:hypothetical protein